MATFTDNRDREWDIRIDGPSILRIREACDPRFLLNDDDNDNTSMRLGSDPALLCHVIFLLCERQRGDRSISPEEFYREVIGNGEAIEAAGEAVRLAIENFTPPRKREYAVAIASKQRSVEQKAMDLALARINDPALEAKILASLEIKMDAEIEKALTRLGNATDSPASSVSPPPV